LWNSETTTHTELTYIFLYESSTNRINYFHGVKLIKSDVNSITFELLFFRD